MIAGEKARSANAGRAFSIVPAAGPAEPNRLLPQRLALPARGARQAKVAQKCGGLAGSAPKMAPKLEKRLTFQAVPVDAPPGL